MDRNLIYLVAGLMLVMAAAFAAARGCRAKYCVSGLAGWWAWTCRQR